ncbi:MAG: hypothetical protein OXI60_09085 [Acidiferrobacterales bacterium]|nr:hypothetical protein [Acidiferrobacterales bacterium]
MQSLNNSILIISKMLVFAEKPQNLPASYGLVVFYAVALLLVTSFLNVVGEYYEILPSVAVQIVIEAAIVWTILRISGRIARWKQTITALFGTDCLIQGVMFLPVSAMWSSTTTNPEGTYWGGMVIVLFGIWSLAVSVLIIKESLEISKLKAFFICFGLAILTSIIVISVVGSESFEVGTS